MLKFGKEVVVGYFGINCGSNYNIVLVCIELERFLLVDVVEYMEC